MFPRIRKAIASHFKTLGSLAGVLTLIIPSASHVNAGDLNSDTQGWIGLSIKKKEILKYVHSSFQSQMRQNENLKNFQRIDFRVSIGTPLGKKNSVWIGYTGVVVDNPMQVIENRWWQQLKTKMFSFVDENIIFTNRMRFEQRFFEGGFKTVYRFRERIKGVFTIVEKFQLKGIVQNEIFFNLNTTGKSNSGFEQNRLLTGIEKEIRKNLKCELGYLMRYAYQKDKDLPDNLDHITSIMLVVEL